MNSRIVVVAGPNGCGKTTFVQEYLGEHPFPYISADAIAEGMDTGSIENVRLEAGREFIKQVTTQIKKRESFVVETTLSGLMFTRILREAREVEYDISILFIFLGSAEACLARIQERVRKGGHSVPEEDILRRFPRSIKNF